MADDVAFMREALRLAGRGRGKVEPNPMVGCVITRAGRVIGRGWHQKFGGPHAEVNAVNDAGGRVAGATVYVTLEPCSHVGKTPPCADLLIRHGVGRVVVACRDPFPKVAGRGIRKLRRAGIRVDVGLLGDAARELNAPYFKLIETGFPYVIAKWAMTIDGKIATRTGDSKWISSDAARRVVHRLRSQVDAVVIGIGTALADDPELTCRLVRGRNPRRIVLDTHARLPLRSRLVETAREVPVIVATSKAAPERRLNALMKRGCGVVLFPTVGGRVSARHVVRWLGAMRITNVLVEGGAAVLGSFFDAGLVDEVLVFVGPVVVGGGKPPVLGVGAERIATAPRLGPVAIRRFGDSLLVRGRIRS